jgi:hypothetical protein
MKITLKMNIWKRKLPNKRKFRRLKIITWMKKGKKKSFILDQKSHNDEKVEIFEIIKWMEN